MVPRGGAGGLEAGGIKCFWFCCIKLWEETEGGGSQDIGEGALYIEMNGLIFFCTRDGREREAQRMGGEGSCFRNEQTAIRGLEIKASEPVL